MGLVIGIDVGGSTTKIVGLKAGQILSPMFITAADPITSLFGAFGKYIYDNGITLGDIEHVMLTGVGSSGVTTPIYGLPTSKVGEFESDGLGAKYAVKTDPIMVLSMGSDVLRNMTLQTFSTPSMPANTPMVLVATDLTLMSLLEKTDLEYNAAPLATACSGSNDIRSTDGKASFSDLWICGILVEPPTRSMLSMLLMFRPAFLSA